DETSASEREIRTGGPKTFFFQAEDGIRDYKVTGVQTCALPILPEDAMRRAERLTLDCDLFLAIGSSLVVWPAAGFPLTAKRHGARLAIINREATEFDEIADLVVREDIGTVLSPFIVH